MVSKLLFLVALAAGAVSFGDMVHVDLSSEPGQYLGKVYANDGVNPHQFAVCAGMVVARKVVLTANHCVEGAKHLFFFPRYKRGVMAGRAVKVPVVKVVASGSSKPEDDWAFLILDKEPLAKDRPQFGFKNLTPSTELKTGDKLLSMGYSRDYERGEVASESECQVLKLYQSYVMSDCHQNHGGSGGPVFKVEDDGSYSLIALNSAAGVLNEKKSYEAYKQVLGYAPPDHLTLQTPTDAFIDTWSKLRDNSPSGSAAPVGKVRPASTSHTPTGQLPAKPTSVPVPQGSQGDTVDDLR